MGVKGARRPSLFIRYIKGPIRALTRARDLYVQSLTGGGGHVSYGNAMGCPTPQIPAVPRSFSANAASAARFATEEDELRDLIRRASSVKTDQAAEFRRSKSTAPYGGAAMVKKVPRCRTTVGFGRIEEDRALDFHEEDGVGLLRGRGEGNYPIPRSRSCAVSGRI